MLDELADDLDSVWSGASPIMDKSLQESIIEQAEEQGYKVLEVDEDCIWFSTEGNDSAADRTAVLDQISENAPPGFTVLSTDFRYRGPMAQGWKSDSMMMLRLTEQGRGYVAMTDEEREELQDKIWRPPTQEDLDQMEEGLRRIGLGRS